MTPDVGRGIAGLRRVAFLLERELAPTYRVKAFRGAAATLTELPTDAVAQHVQRGTLTDLPGIGPKTSTVFEECARGGIPAYLAELETHPAPDPGEGAALLAALCGDLHVHSDWSDGGSPIHEMALTACELGHDYAVLTDHSPTLKVANGLTPDRLRQQLDVVDQVNAELAPFRLLTGIEVDILEDGSLDQEPELLERLDLVVAPVHSKLRSPREAMTRRMVTAIANPHMDVLGHCTGQMVAGNRKTSGVGVRGRLRGRGAPTVRRRRRDQLPAGAARPAATTDPTRLGPGLPLLDRHRCTRAGVAGLAGVRGSAS